MRGRLELFRIGVDNREHIIDELVLIKNSLSTRLGSGFVSQIHLKGDMDACRLIQAHSAKLVCPVRNIFDGRISFDNRLTTRPGADVT